MAPPLDQQFEQGSLDQPPSQPPELRPAFSQLAGQEQGAPTTGNMQAFGQQAQLFMIIEKLLFRLAEMSPGFAGSVGQIQSLLRQGFNQTMQGQEGAAGPGAPPPMAPPPNMMGGPAPGGGLPI
jgi:hypothetical protein